MGFFSRGVTVPAEAKAPVAAAPSVGPPVVTGTALPAPLLTAAEASKVAQLRELVANEPPCKNMPLDDACLMRYLRARNMDVEKSATMLKATIAWRHSFGADAILDQMQLIQTEGRTGKTFVAPFRDREGRSVLVLRPRMENTRSHTGNIVHLVYQLERVVASMAADGPEKLFLMIDFKGYSMMNAPPMKTSLETLHILQNHYPERLGKAVLLDAPWLFSGAFRAITPFIDPVTREKINFLNTADNEQHIDQLGQMIDRAQVERDLGGLLEKPHFNEAAYFDPAADPLQLKEKASHAVPAFVVGAMRR